MKTLHLTLKKKWFDMISSGEKKEEYREIKQYWINRFTWHEFHTEVSCINSLKDACYSKDSDADVIKQRFWDAVCFKNGYGKNSPSVTRRLLFITYGIGRPEWGADQGKEYFIIKLGEKIHKHSSRGNEYVEHMSEGVDGTTR